MPGRWAGTDYRYGMQSQEMDDEIKGHGNSINYKYRMHDPRLGRFFAVDPLTAKYPYYTPYSFSGNKVISAIELEGLEENELNNQYSNPSGAGAPSFFSYENADYIEGDKRPLKEQKKESNGNGKIKIKVVTYADYTGLSAGHITVTTPKNAVTGFWNYEATTGSSFTVGAGIGIEAEIFSVTLGDVKFKSGIKSDNLAGLLNKGPLINTLDVSGLFKYSSVTGYDSPQTMNEVWSANTFGGGVATGGVAGARSISTFTNTPLSENDSIIRAVNDSTLNGRKSFLLNKFGTSDTDSIKSLLK